ncbi:hypothetical protein TrCOL_g9415, partial [Triparma columacea]
MFARSLALRRLAFRRNTAVLSSRFFSSLPDHEVVGMPALSPTMESGTLSSWKVGQGDEFSAGDVLAEIETDKASIDFVTEDDGICAKLLVAEGAEIAVGAPIMITVEEMEDVSAFDSYEAEEPAAPSPPAATPPPPPAATPPPPPAATPPPPAAVTPPPTPTTSTPPAPAPSTPGTLYPWSTTPSAISASLAAAQQEYLD